MERRSGLEWENLEIPSAEKRNVDLSMYSSNSSSGGHGNPSNKDDGFGKLGYNLQSSYYDDIVMREPLTGLRLGRQKEYGAAVSSLPVSAVVPVAAKRSRASYQNMQNPCCQVEGCNLDLKLAKDYHRRHRICESHSKSPKVIVAGMERRFCQQCSRFHELAEFDDKKRSCRRRLSDHNARRRRVQPESVAHHPLTSPGMPASAAYDEGFQSVLLNGLPVAVSNSSWENVNSSQHIAGAVLDHQCTPGASNSAAAIPPEDVISAQSLLSSNNSWSMNEGESAAAAAAAAMKGLMSSNNHCHHHHHHLSSVLESNNINNIPSSASSGAVSVPLVHSSIHNNLQDSSDNSSHLQEFHLFYDHPPPPRFYSSTTSTSRNL